MAALPRCTFLILPAFLVFGLEGAEAQEAGSGAEGQAPIESGASLLQHPEWKPSVDGWAAQLAEHVSREDIGGIAAAIVVHGESVWAQGFGWADREAEIPMVPDAIFRTGPVSRVVTAMILMRLVDQGRLRLDEPVKAYIPEIASIRDRYPDDPEVTFRHLASHTAGLGRNYDVGRDSPGEPWQAGVIRAFDSLAFMTPPGEEYEDSPIGYGLLGLALERADGRRFVDLAEEEVLNPLGMHSSSFAVNGTDLESRLATAYPNRKNGTIENPDSIRRRGAWGYTLPSSGLYSTVEDLGRLLGALAGAPGPDFLSDSSLLELISPQTPGGLNPPREPGVPTWGPRLAIFKDGDGNTIVSPEVLDPPYALGLSVLPEEEGTIVHGGGIVAGYTTYMAIDTQTGIGAVLLRNYWRGDTHLREAALGMVNHLNGMVRPPERVFDSWVAILLGLAGAIVAGALLGRFLQSLNA